jgi:hypothetical protein
VRIKLDEMLAELGIENTAELFAPHWDESAASLPEDGPEFLDPARIAEFHDFAKLPPELAPLLQETAARVRQTPALTHLAWHCYRLLFEEDDYDKPSMAKWPELTALLGDHWGIFYMLIALGAVPLTRAAHKRRGIPEAITRDTLSNLDEPVWMWRSAHPGTWGFRVSVLYWFRHYTAGRICRLGRMEYMIQPFRGQIRAFRNRRTDEVLALAEDGVEFNSAGYIDAETEAATSHGGWTARLEMDEEAVTGCPVSPTGVGLRCQVRLPLKTWRPVLKPGDPMLDTHIPGGGGMTPERCADTMRQALEFFPRYFPDRPFVGFACGSWILNPQLAEIYTPDSNMVKWQRELYLYPIPSGSRSGVTFVFGTDDIDPKTAPRDTSLRRALLEHLDAGGRLIGSGMFFLKEDFDHYGTQHYLSHWPPAVLADAMELDG